VRFGHWHSNPPKPNVFGLFFKDFVEGVNCKTKEFREASTTCKAAVAVLRELEDALAPWAAMEKLGE
jgi:hypothetical protein